ncbi:hypothetical protein ACFC1R_36360 [Kitasatospora sp. NPDC056138]|uniref:hypothetical protein n=1 Tax=Kitasatospora sp. NPDC056138 TaxID=3345724 RepID=UPI0035E0984E
MLSVLVNKATSASAVLGPLADEARYVNRRVSYNLRRAHGTSIPLQVVLLTRRRRAGIGDNITEIIEGHGGLTRF